MGSLTGCLAKMGKLIDADDAAALRASARNYVTDDGLDKLEAAKTAVRDLITTAETELAEVIAQAKSARGDSAEPTPTERAEEPAFSRKQDAGDDSDPELDETARAALTEAEANDAQGKGDIRFSRKHSDIAQTTGIKNAVTDSERVSAGKEPIARSPEKSNIDTLRGAKQAIQDDPLVGDEAIARLNRAGVGGITLHDEAILLVYKAMLLQLRNRASKAAASANTNEDAKTAAREEWEKLEAKLTAIDEAAVGAGREWGRFGQFRQRMIKDDFTLEALERKERVRLGRPLSIDEAAKVKEMAEKIDVAQKKIDELSEKLVNTESLIAYDNMLKNVEHVRKERPRLDALRNAADAARARIAAARGVSSAMKQSGAVISPAIFYDYAVIGAYHIANGAFKFTDWVDAMRADLGNTINDIREHLPAIFRAAEKELLKASTTDQSDAVSNVVAKTDPGNISNRDVYRLAEAHVKAGMRGEAQVMAATHKTLKELGLNVSERDVRRMFSDYGNAKFPSQDAAKAELRQLRALVQMQESIDRLEEGLPALKSGPQRDKDTQEIREKRSRLNELLKHLTAGAKTPEQLASYNDARIRNLSNQIEDLQKQIATGTRPDPRAKAELSEDVAQLIARRDALKRERDSIDSGARNNEAEKQALRKRIADVEEKIAGKVKPAREQESRVDDEEMTKLRDQLAALRTKRAEMAAENSARKAVEGQIENLLQRLAGKAKPEPKAPKADSADIANLKRIRNELSGQLRALERPPVDEEARYQKARGKAIAKRMEELRKRINDGDFAAHKRVPRTLNEENQKAQYELDKVKEEFLRHQFMENLKLRSTAGKIFGTAADVLHLARALMTSFDLSAVFRQGGFIALGHPMRAIKGIVPMFRAFGSQQAEHAVMQEIKNRPNARLYHKHKLALTEIGAGPASKIEEVYASRWLDALPRAIGGGLVRGSGRAYVTFLNKLRADSFDAMAASLSRTGELSDAEAKAIADYINTATGRARIGAMENAANGLNAVFFAPRLVASRFSLLAGLPMYGGTNRTRKMIITDYARFIIGAGVVMALAAFGADEDDSEELIGTDPRSFKFGKIRWGKSYIDPLGGLAQVTVFVTRLLTGETVTGEGHVKPLRPNYTLTNFRRLLGEDIEPHKLSKDGSLSFGADDASDVIMRFLRSKLAPAPGAIINALAGENMIGEPMSPLDAATNIIVPMSFGDIMNAMEANGVERGTALALMLTFGIGVQTHLPRSVDEEVSDLVRDRLKKLPLDEWESEFDALRTEHAEKFANKELAIYKKDGKFGNQGEPRRDQYGNPVIVDAQD